MQELGWVTWTARKPVFSLAQRESARLSCSNTFVLYVLKIEIVLHAPNARPHTVRVGKFLSVETVHTP